MSPKILLVSTLTSIILALAGCSADAGGSDSAEETERSADALSPQQGGGSSGRLGFVCSGLFCTCTGDVDCNDMFSSGNCGPGPSVCDDTTSTPKCTCSRFRVVGPSREASTGPVTSGRFAP
jgi:hypothetical protein